MTDKYESLRAALDAGPTPGPWIAKDVSDAGLEIHMQAPEPHQSKHWPAFSTQHADIKKELVAYEAWVQFPSEKLKNIQARTALYIAAANPAVIRDLLAERDRLRDAVQETVNVLQSDTQAITDTVWVTGDMPETLLDRCLGALAQEQP